MADNMAEEEWEVEKEEDMIDLYQSNWILWSSDKEEYRDRDKKRRVKELMAQRLKVTVPEMEKHWKSLRTQFRKAVAVGQSGSAAKVLTERQKQILGRLRFLTPYTKGASEIISSLDMDLDSGDESPTVDDFNDPVVPQNPVYVDGVEEAGTSGDVGGGGGGQLDPATGSAATTPTTTTPSTSTPTTATATVATSSTSAATASTSATNTAEPSTSGASSRTTRSGKRLDDVVLLSPKKRNSRKKASAAAGKAPTTPEPQPTPGPSGNSASPRSPTPPRPGQIPVKPTPVKRGRNTKKKDPKISLDELRELLVEDEATMNGTKQVDKGPDRTFSTLDNSPLVEPPAKVAKTAVKRTVVDEEKVATLREMRGLIHDQRQQHKKTPVTEPSKQDDEISVWAGQCERKVRRITDPLLQEDVMDHISMVLKRATRGEFSAVQTHSASPCLPPPHPHSPMIAHASFVRHPSQFQAMPTPTPTPTHMSSSHQYPSGSGDQQVHAFAQWLQTPNSPGMPQGPVAQQIMQAGTVARLPNNDYTNLSNANGN